MTARRWATAIALLCAALALPLWVSDVFVIQILFRVAIFAVLGVAWNLIGGYAGQLSVGHAAYFGLGGYGFSLLHANFGIDTWLALFLGAAIAGLAAIVIGSITFRLQGHYFALSTIASAEILRIVALNSSFTHGAIGILSPALFSHRGSDAKFFVAAVILLAASLAFAGWTHGSRFGYYLRAVRQDEDTAMAVGIDPARYKLLALIPSALFTGMAGGIYASFSMFISPESILGIDISIQAAAIAMLGGAGTVWGPLIGSIVLTISAEAFKAFFKEAHLLIYGGLLIVVVLFLPGGLMSLLPRLRRLRPARGGGVA